MTTATKSARAMTALRSARSTKPFQSIRCSSSEAGPSSPSPSTSSSSRRLPRPILRNLVELHHHSSTFLQDPSTLPSAFKTTFQSLANPILTPYHEFANHARNLHSRRSLGGMDTLREKHEQGAGGMMSRGDSAPTPLKISRSAFSGEDSWKSPADPWLTEREMRVKEALYGMLERGTGSGVSSARGSSAAIEVGLEGVEEYAEARGKEIQEDAKLWQSRHDET